MFSIFYFENDWNDFFMWRWGFFFICEGDVFIWKWCFLTQKSIRAFCDSTWCFNFYVKMESFFFNGKVMLFYAEDCAFFHIKVLLRVNVKVFFNIKCCCNDKVKSFDTIPIIYLNIGKFGNIASVHLVSNFLKELEWVSDKFKIGLYTSLIL